MAEKNSFNILQLLRLDAGFSQVQLSNYTGISVSMIRKLESGERSLNKISLESAFKLSVVLQFPMDYFVDTSEIKSNRKYVSYWNDFLDNLRYCFPFSHEGDKDYVKYSNIGNPYEILEKNGKMNRKK